VGEKMKKSGILNAPLSEIVARLGHTDKLVICDSGLPIPQNAFVIDLAVTNNVPRFIEVLNVVMQELAVEKIIIADQLFTSGNGVLEDIKKITDGILLEHVDHEEFKNITRSGNNVYFVRTGDITPYANIILECGVTF